MTYYLPPRRPIHGQPVGSTPPPRRLVPQEAASSAPEPEASSSPPVSPDLVAKVAELEAALAAERERVEELRGKADAYLDLLQRTQADFLNYKRRQEREREEEALGARADLLARLLPALDDLERALSHVPPDLRGHPWVEGLALVARQLRLALAKAGVERLGVPGEPFDPRVHEAIAYEPRADYAEGQVAEVLRPGYRLGPRVIRPAEVTVARGT
ncbi:MAG TPA: nucleotide exchange factor GrpE [Chloroflexota bacterium]|nr:nucleotide exchange factor GrpE [Chloroflexota bacterium]